MEDNLGRVWVCVGDYLGHVGGLQGVSLPACSCCCLIDHCEEYHQTLLCPSCVATDEGGSTGTEGGREREARMRGRAEVRTLEDGCDCGRGPMWYGLE